MSDLVEIIARALCKAEGANPDGHGVCEKGLDPEPAWRYFDSEARAVLTALSEAGWVVVPIKPTQEMVDACWGDTVDWAAVEEAEVEGVQSIYRAMLSASPSLSKKEG